MKLNIAKYGFTVIHTSPDIGDWYGEMKDNGLVYYIAISSGSGWYNQVSMGVKLGDEIFHRFYVRNQKQLDFLMWSNRLSNKFNKKKTVIEKIEALYFRLTNRA